MAPKRQTKRTKRARTEKGSSSVTIPHGLSEEALKRYKQMESKRRICPNVFINWEVIDDYGQRRHFNRLLQDPAWATLFSIREKIYKGLTLEFLATYTITRSDRIFGLDNQVSFNAFGKHHSISMTDFCRYTGLYTPEYIAGEGFRNLPTRWPRNLQVNHVWRHNLARTSNYDPSRSRGANLRKASYRILHSLLVHSLNGRIHSTGVISQLDLYPLWSMITGTRINVAVELAFALRNQAQLSKAGIFCGAYITRLIKNMGEFPEHPPADEVGESYPMSDAALKQFGLPKVPNQEESSAEEEEEPTQNDTAKRLDDLTAEVKKLRRKNKSLKRYIKSVATAFADKMKVVLPDCTTSSSSDDDN